jgi:superfamily II DNA or RNA helicase
MNDSTTDEMNTVRYQTTPPQWVIRVEPDILIKLKRWFEKIPKGAQETCELNDSPLNAFELLTFVQHFELGMSDVDRAYLEGRADAHRAKLAKVKRLLSPDYTPRTFTLALPPRDYQQSGADHCIERGALFCADELGVGKTGLGICVLSAPGSLPALVTCPKHLAHQWKRQIDRFLPGLRIHIAKTGSYYDLTEHRGKTVPFPDVVIVAMSKLHGWAPHLAGIVQCVIADEAHRFRHEWTDTRKVVRTRAYGAMLHLRDRVPRRLFLSGTVINNYGGEAWNVFNALEEDCLGTSTEFAREWCGSQYFNEKASVKDPDALGLHLRKIGAMIRRTRKDVGRELPPLTKLVEPVDLEDSAALKKVSADVAQFARLVLARNVSGFDKMSAGRELDWRVRQATGLDKAPFIANFVRMVVESSGPVVLFGWHKLVYKVWKDLLCDFNPVFFTGDETDRQKEYALDEFMSGRSKVFVMSLRSGEGVDGLQTVSSNVVIGELDWSPKVIEQCIGRVFRDGQPNPVFAYMPISDDGSDPVMADVLDVKSWQSDGILDPGAPRVELFDGADDHNRAQRLAEAWLEKYSPGELAKLRAEQAAADEAERIAKEKARAEAKVAALRGPSKDARQGAASDVG